MGKRNLGVSTLIALLVLTSVLPLAAPGRAYAFPAPVQVYYVTLPEADGLTVLDTINTAANTPMFTYFSIAIALDDTYVYYDQWEDGYAVDIANPTPAEIYSATNLDGVQVWGNGEADDGCAPNISGTPVTCTDANDVLRAGDVIIPYNSVDIPRVAAAQTYVLDQFGVVAYNNQNGNANWSTDWVEVGDDVNPNYRDEFASQAYNLSVGSIDWSYTSWTEVGDDGSPTSGYVRVDTTNGLRFGRAAATPVGTAIYRAANLSGYTSATLSYSYSETANEAADAVQVQVRNPPGAWQTLATITGLSGSGTGSHDITAYMDADTEVRFYVSAQIESNEYIYFDNVNIALTPAGPSGPAAGDIRVTSGALRFTATQVGDSINRGVNLSAADDCTTLSFTLGQSGIDATGDNLAVEISADGGANYTILETYDAAADAGAKSYPIPSAYRTANFRVRFRSIDALETDEYWSFDDVRVRWNCSLPIRFDGGDKIGATFSIAMARATWASGSGTLNAFAHEMYPANEWGTAYESPVGTNTANAGQMFEYSGLSVMAAQDSTTVQIDANADGTYETTTTLGQGQVTLASGILQGARVQADRPVQVVLVTGDVGSTYASRDMTLLPVNVWGSSYWSPVGVVNSTYPTRLFLYNRSTNGNIYVTCERYGVANTTLGPVAARGVVTVDLTNGQGARCYASDAGGTPTTDTIFAVGTVDSTNTAYDWSFTLFPDTFLTTEALVGLGLGKDPTDANSTENGSPLWVTAACSSGSTYIYVDWDNNGVADGVDTDGDDIAETGSENGISIARLQSVRLFEPGADTEPYDQSGARVWSRTASGMGDYDDPAAVPGCRLAVAWGEDPANATAASPGLDVGTSVPPLRLVEATKTLVLLDDNDGDGLLSPGDTAWYIMTVRNSGPSLVQNVYIHDTVPDNMTYVRGTTGWNTTGSDPWTLIPDDPDPTYYPLDVPGGVLLGDLDPGEIFYIRFQVLLDPGYAYTEVQNCNVAYTGAGNLGRCAANLVAVADWGDLPDSYGTSLTQNGPRHSPSTLRLGSLFDREYQGQPGADANGDDGALIGYPDDEDGVANTATTNQWLVGTGSFNVTVTGGPGCLNAWMDFTNDAGNYPGGPGYTYYGDGNFTRAGGGYDSATVGATTYSEHIIQNLVLNTGTTSVPVSVPPGLNWQTPTTSFYFRFRLSPEPCGTIAPTGPVEGGEVEDYRFNIGAPTVVRLARFEAWPEGAAVHVEWETVTEVDNLGFNLYRSDSPDGPQIQLNDSLIPSLGPGSPIGFVYTFLDEMVTPGVLYYYWLEDVDVYGAATRHGPVTAFIWTGEFLKVYLPMVVR